MEYILNNPETQGVTVVVPTLNRGDYLYDCLTDLLAQDHRPLEILVVDQSTIIPEAVQQMVTEHSDIISYHQVAFKGLPPARNYGWRNARYDAIIYVDDDIRCPPNLVAEHLRALQLPNVGAVAGRINEVNRPESSAIKAGQFNRWTATITRGFHLQGEYDVSHVPGGNFSIWKNVAEEVGGVEEALNVGAALYEETEFSLRIIKYGYRIYFNSKAALDHLASSTGGCRVNEVDHYTWALAHNRAILIKRHTSWYHKPTALLQLLRLSLAYAISYRKLSIIPSSIHGLKAGYHKI